MEWIFTSFDVTDDKNKIGEIIVKIMTIFEELGDAYEERHGLLYPIVSMETESVNVSKYGLLWMEYMKEDAQDRYKSLLRFGKLEEKVLEVNEEAYEMLECIKDTSL